MPNYSINAAITTTSQMFGGSYIPYSHSDHYIDIQLFKTQAAFLLAINTLAFQGCGDFVIRIFNFFLRSKGFELLRVFCCCLLRRRSLCSF